VVEKKCHRTHSSIPLFQMHNSLVNWVCYGRHRHRWGCEPAERTEIRCPNTLCNMAKGNL